MSDLMADLRRSIERCTDCSHLVREHSREPGVGCLHDIRSDPCRAVDTWACPCTEPSDSPADQ